MQVKKYAGDSNAGLADESAVGTINRPLRIAVLFIECAKAGPGRMEMMSPLIMVIEDSQTTRKILEVCLRRAGYVALCFQDGMEAIRWLMRSGQRSPDLVILDIGLPGMDGYEIMHYAKMSPAFAGTVFIVLSGRGSVLDKLKGRLSGASVYLTKPFQIQDVVAVVEKYLGPAPLAVPSMYERA